MTVLSRTAANFRIKENTIFFNQPIQLGETVEAGQPLYEHTDGLWYLLDSAAAQTKILFASIPGDANDWIRAIESGEFEPGATVTVGEIYAAAPNTSKGEFEQFSALASSAHIMLLAYGVDASTLKINVVNMGVQKP